MFKNLKKYLPLVVIAGALILPSCGKKKETKSTATRYDQRMKKKKKQRNKKVKKDKRQKRRSFLFRK